MNYYVEGGAGDDEDDDDFLDDRQGMNSGEQQFTKAERGGGSARHGYSLDGCSSILGESSFMNVPDSPGLFGSSSSKSSTRGGTKCNHHRSKSSHANCTTTSNNKNNNKSFSSKSMYQASRRSKSPSSVSRRGRKRMGLFAIASRLKLTRRHESIAKLQLSILQSGLIYLKRLDDPDFQTFLPHIRMSAQQFEERVRLIRRYPVLASIEYAFANRYELYSCKQAQLIQNQFKNTYKKCLPYDYNRVVLKTIPQKAQSDYINASHVDTYLKPNAYIAAMGPNEQTIEDFWRMVWEQKSFVIVMLTKVFDFIKVMCNQYWPIELKKPERFGNLEVTLLYEEPLADFVIRTIKLTKCRPKQADPTNQDSKNGIINDPLADEMNDKIKHTRDARYNDQVEFGAQNDDDDYYDDNDSQLTDDSDLSEEVVLNTDIPSVSLSPSPQTITIDTGKNSNSGMSNIPRARSPKFILTKHRHLTRKETLKNQFGTRRRSISADNIPLTRLSTYAVMQDSESNSHKNLNKARAGGQLGHSKQDLLADNQGIGSINKQGRPNSLNLTHITKDERSQSDNLVQQQRNLHHYQQHNATQMSKLCESTFLHPLYGINNQRAGSPFRACSSLSGSSLGLASIPGSPTSPATPATPSSAGLNAGLDRSSATRRAVKKRRRAHVKNTRPMMTQFQVPNESQLADDDDELIEDHESGCQLREDGAQQQQANMCERIIYQFHYHNWAAHTCPFISSLLHFRRRVRICMDEMSKSGKTGPSIVHCSDGCGRTGTYLCIDANLELAEEDGIIDVYNYTKKLRQSRKNLIDNEEQYKFVYDTIEEALFCGKTWFNVTELHQKLKFKSQRNPAATNKNEYQLEYEKICRMTGKFSIGDCAGGHRVENREKNRDVSTVPPDNFRPYLTSFQTNDNTDYINAVFVDGYTRSKEYIVTEWPLHRTMSDFWSLIYDHDCNSVILLANPPESSNYPSFLPSEKELRRKFGPVFSAEMVSYTHYNNIKSWIYTINKKNVSLTEVMAGVKSEPKTTQVFQITCWPQGHRVPTSTNALVELMNMVERWRQRTAYGPVCVVSLNGKSRAGVYCAANVAIEQVVQHGEVDVFHAVKTVRRHRPQLIENMTEYKYCYDLILHYVLYYLNQATTG